MGEKHGLQVVDLYALTEEHPEYFMDGVHPNALGNQAIAEHISGSSRFQRRVCCEPIFFDEDDLIQEVKMTSQGAGEPLRPGEYLPASLACLASDSSGGRACGSRPIAKGLPWAGPFCVRLSPAASCRRKSSAGSRSRFGVNSAAGMIAGFSALLAQIRPMPKRHGRRGIAVR